MSFFSRLFSFSNRDFDLKTESTKPRTAYFGFLNRKVNSRYIEEGSNTYDVETQTADSFIGKFKDKEVETTIQVPISLTLVNVISKMNKRLSEVETAATLQTDETEIESPEISNAGSDNDSSLYEYSDKQPSNLMQNKEISRTSSGFTPVLLKRRSIIKKSNPEHNLSENEKPNSNILQSSFETSHVKAEVNHIASDKLQTQVQQQEEYQIQVPHDQFQAPQDQNQFQQTELDFPQKQTHQEVQHDIPQDQPQDIQPQQLPQGNIFRTLFTSRLERGPPSDIGGFSYTPIDLSNAQESKQHKTNQPRNQNKFRKGDRSEDDNENNDNDGESDNDDDDSKNDLDGSQKRSYRNNRGDNNKYHQYNGNNNRSRGGYSKRRGGNSNYNHNESNENEENKNSNYNSYRNNGRNSRKWGGNSYYNLNKSRDTEGNDDTNSNDNNYNNNNRRKGANSNYNNTRNTGNASYSNSFNHRRNNRNSNFNSRYSKSNRENDDGDDE